MILRNMTKVMMKRWSDAKELNTLESNCSFSKMYHFDVWVSFHCHLPLHYQKEPKHKKMAAESDGRVGIATQYFIKKAEKL